MSTILSLNERQRAFATALLDPERPVPIGLVGPDGHPSAKRFNVYRNNVVAGLIATLKDAYPAVARIVGDQFFVAMGRIYVADEPPNSPIMLDYGKGFPDFIRTFEPVATLPYLADVAEIESAWAEAYHAQDMPPLEAEAFTKITSQDLPNVAVVLHPSCRIVRSPFPAVTIWQMNISDAEPVATDLAGGGENAFVLRSGTDVEVHSIAAGAADFIEALHEGYSMIEAMKQAMAVDYRFNLAECLSGMLTTRAFVAFEIAGKPSQPTAPGQVS